MAGSLVTVNIPPTKILQIQRDPLRFLGEMAAEHGDFIQYPLGRGVAYQLTAPDLIQHVLLDNHRNYSKDTIQFNQLARFTGRGLLTSDGDFWLRQRRMSQPAFHRRRLAAMSKAMTTAVDRMLSRWTALPSGSAIDVDDEMMRVTLEIIGETLLGLDLEETALGLAHAALVMLDDIVYRAKNLLALPAWLPTPRNRRVKGALAQLDALIAEAIARHRADPDAFDTILAMLLEARDKRTGAAMTADELRDEMMTFLVAGHETAASALNWVFYLLGVNPAVQARLEAEVDSVLDGRSPTIADLPALPYGRQIIDEAMRLYPPSWVISRRALEADRLRDHDIPPRAILILSPHALHHAAAVWPDPERFDPDRFAPASRAKHHRFAYIPFGGGPRLCIGDTFALTETHLLLTAVAQRFRLLATTDTHPPVDAAVTIRPVGGLLMTLRPRHNM